MMNVPRLRAYWHVMMMAAREDRANPARLAGSIALGVVRMILISAIYKAAYDLTHAHTLPYANAVWSIGLYFTFIIGLSIRNVYRLVEKEVKDGSVEVSLLKPLDWRTVKICQQVGKNLLECALIAITFSVTLLILVGPPVMHHVTAGFILGYLLLMALAIVSGACMFLSVGLAAFWLNDATSVYRIVDKAVMIFAGAFVPIALLPSAVQSFLRYSPFGVYSASTQLFNPGLAKHLLPTIVAGLLWTAVLLYLCGLIWRRAQHRIEVNGG